MRLEGFSSWGSGYKNPGRESRIMKSFSGGGKRIPPLLAAVFAFCLVFLVGSLIALSFGKTQPAEPKVDLPVAPVVKAQPVVEMEEIVVPVRALEPGQIIEAGMLTKISVPRSAVPLGAVRSVEEIDGMYTKGNVGPNQPIVRSFLSREKPVNPVQVLIPDGYRAVTINTNATSGVEGWARAGSRVDVQFLSTENNVPTIIAIVQNAKIISAERQLTQNAEPGASVPATVTLLVNEFDAQKISLTSTLGALVMHMRGSGDNEISNITSTPLNLTDLYSNDVPQSDLQGRVKLKNGDGSYEEWAVMKGNLQNSKGSAGNIVKQ